MDFGQWLESNVNHYDFVIIDPPWNYDDKTSKLTDVFVSDLWENVKLIDIFQKLDVDYMFLWVTTNMLPVMFNCYQESQYQFKTLIPWIKLTSNENLFYGLGNSFRNCVEYVALFQKPRVPALRFNDKNIILEESNDTNIKPKLWENDLIDKLIERGLSGIYIFSGGTLKFIDNVRPITIHEQTKVELF